MGASLWSFTCKIFILLVRSIFVLDYMLEIHGKNETIWNVTFSTWGPNTVDYDLVAQHYRSPDNIYVTPIYNSSILALSTDGRKKPAQWVGQIPNVAISVFDVLDPAMILIIILMWTTLPRITKKA